MDHHDTRRRHANASPDAAQVADGLDIHSQDLRGLLDIHARTDRHFRARHMLWLRVAQINDRSRWTYCADLDRDAQHLAYVTLDHVETVAYVDMRAKVVQMTEENAHYHAELAGVLDGLGYTLEPMR